MTSAPTTLKFWTLQDTGWMDYPPWRHWYHKPSEAEVVDALREGNSGWSRDWSEAQMARIANRLVNNRLARRGEAGADLVLMEDAVEIYKQPEQETTQCTIHPVIPGLS